MADCQEDGEGVAECEATSGTLVLGSTEEMAARFDATLAEQQQQQQWAEEQAYDGASGVQAVSAASDDSGAEPGQTPDGPGGSGGGSPPSGAGLAGGALDGGTDGGDKVQICYDFTKGMCTRGDKCKYSHDIATIVHFNSREKGICFDYLRGQCHRGLLCRFSHDLSNIAQQCQVPDAPDSAQASAPGADAVDAAPGGAAQQQRRVASICYDFVKGLCQRGAECRYSHDITLIVRTARGGLGPGAGPPPAMDVCYDFLRRVRGLGGIGGTELLLAWVCSAPSDGLGTRLLGSGRCSRGSSCKYSHRVATLGDGPLGSSPWPGPMGLLPPGAAAAAAAALRAPAHVLGAPVGPLVPNGAPLRMLLNHRGQAAAAGAPPVPGAFAPHHAPTPPAGYLPSGAALQPPSTGAAQLPGLLAAMAQQHLQQQQQQYQHYQQQYSQQQQQQQQYQHAAMVAASAMVQQQQQQRLDTFHRQRPSFSGSAGSADAEGSLEPASGCGSLGAADGTHGLPPRPPSVGQAPGGAQGGFAGGAPAFGPGGTCQPSGSVIGGERRLLPGPLATGADLIAATSSGLRTMHLQDSGGSGGGRHRQEQQQQPQQQQQQQPWGSKAEPRRSDGGAAVPNALAGGGPGAGAPWATQQQAPHMSRAYSAPAEGAMELGALQAPPVHVGRQSLSGGAQMLPLPQRRQQHEQQLPPPGHTSCPPGASPVGSGGGPLFFGMRPAPGTLQPSGGEGGPFFGTPPSIQGSAGPSPTQQLLPPQIYPPPMQLPPAHMQHQALGHGQQQPPPPQQQLQHRLGLDQGQQQQQLWDHRHYPQQQQQQQQRPSHDGGLRHDQTASTPVDIPGVKGAAGEGAAAGGAAVSAPVAVGDQEAQQEGFLGLDRPASGNLPNSLLPLLKEIWKR
ncbi:putative zinc finger protein [Monoraphidium neglectum]|uniref:Putative zinc finger protein n=1 Tax=Monoraphidium neglectum TaxID=145388 RepID=A0A0D2N7D9_9CHLO|nr:putative zinc finger protein [Monoraphidium neglectum]KIZ01761.1 putative zinc finger protein [Monoraphidium neglectum]|eukprot:XP_013900780.1 putative zinc finger protein [Monoraphidium neglectum]